MSDIVEKKIDKNTADLLKMVADFEGEIPGSRRQECGNYLEHDLEGAKAVSRDMLDVLRNWTEANLSYAC